MTYPMMPQPNWGYAPAPALPTGRNQLALVSFLISIVAAPACLVGSIVNVVFETIASYQLLSWVLLVGSLISSISAIVTGGAALHRAKRYPPHQARMGWAVAGLVLGIVGVAFFICTGLLNLAALACTNGPGC
jgi:hypothetical protein